MENVCDVANIIKIDNIVCTKGNLWFSVTVGSFSVEKKNDYYDSLSDSCSGPTEQIGMMQFGKTLKSASHGVFISIFAVTCTWMWKQTRCRWYL